MNEGYTTINLKELKKIYWLFNRGGSRNILISELSNNACSFFLALYLYVLMCRVNWNSIITSEPSTQWFWSTSVNPCSVIFTASPLRDKICTASLVSNAVVSGILMCWSSISSIWKCYSATLLEKKLKDSNILLDGRLTWAEIVPRFTADRVQEEDTLFFLCSETRQTALMLKILGIPPESWLISRYLVWAMQNTVSISRRGVVLDASALHLEIDALSGDSVQADASKVQIKRMAVFLFFISPFFILYYAMRVLIQEFYRHKYGGTGQQNRYTWSAAAQYSLRKKHELPHRFRKRLESIKPYVESVKKSKRGFSGVECAIIIFQFIVTCLLITCLAGSFLSLEEGELNEQLGFMTGVFSAALMISSGSAENDPGPAKRQKIKRKIFSKFGKNYDAVEPYLRHRLKHVVIELLGIVLTPWILIKNLLPKIDEIKFGIEHDIPASTEYPEFMNFCPHTQEQSNFWDLSNSD